MKISNQKGFGVVQIFLLIIVIVSVGLAGRYVYNKQRDKKDSSPQASAKQLTSFKECVDAGNPVMESFPEQCRADGQTFTNEEQQFNNGFNTAAESGKGAFTIIFPDGFSPLQKPLDSDSFYLMGTQQPEIKVGEKVVINELESFGTDAPSLFSVLVHDNFSDPRGTAEDYTLVNGKQNPIAGKKYVYSYEQDEAVGIGYQRFKGDRDYEYIFPLKDGKQLRVFYSVYGVDPRNNLETVQAIIDTIRLN